MSTVLHATHWGVVRSVSLTVGRAVGHGYWFDTHTGGGETNADILNATHRAFKWEVICSVFWIIQDKFWPSVWHAARLCRFLQKNLFIVEEHYNQNTFLCGTNSCNFLFNVVAKQIMQPCLSLCIACQFLLPNKFPWSQLCASDIVTANLLDRFVRVSLISDIQVHSTARSSYK